MPWGKANTAGSVPTELITMKTAGYSNTFTTPVATANGIYSHSAAGASGKGLHQGWIHRRLGTGGVDSLTITAGGSAYTGTLRWSLTGGTVQANGSLTMTANVITGYTIDNRGAGFPNKTAAATITAGGGSGATITVNVGGNAGRKYEEVIVAQSSQTP